MGMYSPNVERLFLGNNKLVGAIRSEIGLMTKLERLELGPSNMEGEIPAELYALPNLSHLKLNNAQFSGPLPENGFGQLSRKIQEIELQNNNFSGAIPIVAIGSSKRLEVLRLDGNDLTGEITIAVCNDRGYATGEINTLKVPCSVTCPDGCCEGHENCPQ